MSQIEVSKAIMHAAIGPASNEVAVSKLVMFALLVPGDGGEDVIGRQAHVWAQRVQR